MNIRRHWIIGIIVGLVLTVSALVIAGAKGNHNASSNGNLTQRLKHEQQSDAAALTVDFSKVSANECNTLVAKTFGPKLVKTASKNVKTPVFDIGAAHPVSGPSDLTLKLWTQSVNIPMSKPYTLATVKATVCRDPEQAAMVMNGLGRGVFDGKTIASRNPWLAAQGNPTTAIKAWARSCYSKSGTVQQQIDRHLACAKVMAATVRLMSAFADGGVHRMDSAWNYNCAGVCYEADAKGNTLAPTIELLTQSDKQERNAYFVVMQMTSKVAPTGCYLKYGFNVGTTSLNGGDQRLAGFSCAKPTPPNPQPSTPGNSQPPTSRSSTPVSSAPPSTPAPSCTPTQQGGENGCNGKQASSRPIPTGGPVIQCGAGQYLDRYTGRCTPLSALSSSAQSSASATASQGQGDSGRGATNTTSVASPSATASVSKSVSPTGNPTGPPPPGK